MPRRAGSVLKGRSNALRKKRIQPCPTTGSAQLLKCRQSHLDVGIPELGRLHAGWPPGSMATNMGKLNQTITANQRGYVVHKHTNPPALLLRGAPYPRLGQVNPALTPSCCIGPIRRDLATTFLMRRMSTGVVGWLTDALATSGTT